MIPLHKNVSFQKLASVSFPAPLSYSSQVEFPTPQLPAHSFPLTDSILHKSLESICLSHSPSECGHLLRIPYDPGPVWECAWLCKNSLGDVGESSPHTIENSKTVLTLSLVRLSQRTPPRTIVLPDKWIVNRISFLLLNCQKLWWDSVSTLHNTIRTFLHAEAKWTKWEKWRKSKHVTSK